MVDVALTRGEGWLLCAICFELHEDPYDNLAVDSEGRKWDVCAGECAEAIGLD